MHKQYRKIRFFLIIVSGSSDIQVSQLGQPASEVSDQVLLVTLVHGAPAIFKRDINRA